MFFCLFKQSCSVTGCNGSLTLLLEVRDQDGVSADVTTAKCEHVYD